MKHALVTTTINVPIVLDQYAADISKHGPTDTGIFVAGDQKTPERARTFCLELSERSGVRVVYLGVEEQIELLSQFPEYDKFLPWNCIQRRNTAILAAYIEGAEVFYTIDDDNFLAQKAYMHSHGSVGDARSFEEVVSDSGWYNICCHLDEASSRKFFHRGFSYNQRLLPEPRITRRQTSGRVIVNAGLWLGDPDVDAVTRLAIAPDVVKCTLTGHLALAHGTVSPFNSQNTAIHRDAIPAYCMHVGVGRYDDIVPSYFVKRIADHLGDYVSFGEPLVRQVRNAHDLWRDADGERTGYSLIDDMVNWLYETTLHGGTYSDCLVELLSEFDRLGSRRACLSSEETLFLVAVKANYMHWLSVLDKC